MSENQKPWHEDDSFWQTWEPYMFDEKRIAGSVDEVTKIIKLLDVRPGANVLDLACGTGRIALEFARRGFDVIGVDRTGIYLDHARQQAEKENLKIELVHEDMRNFLRPNTFDVVVNMYTAFGYFEDQADDRLVLDNVCASLKPGGRLLIDMHGKETLAKIFQEHIYTEKDGEIFLQEHKVTQNWSWMQTKWIIFKGNERTESSFSHRLYSGTEIAAQLTACGFSGADVYGDLDGPPYDNNAKRLIAVGYK